MVHANPTRMFSNENQVDSKTTNLDYTLIKSVTEKATQVQIISSILRTSTLRVAEVPVGRNINELLQHMIVKSSKILFRPCFYQLPWGCILCVAHEEGGTVEDRFREKFVECSSHMYRRKRYRKE